MRDAGYRIQDILHLGSCISAKHDHDPDKKNDDASGNSKLVSGKRINTGKPKGYGLNNY